MKYIMKIWCFAITVSLLASCTDLDETLYDQVDSS